MSETASFPVSTPAPHGHTMVAEYTRGDLVESVHFGSIAVVSAEGETLLAAGAPEGSVYARSSLKPLQLIAMIRAGLELPEELLSLASGSHSGEAMHRDGVMKILALHDLDDSALRTPKDLPLDSVAKAEWLRSGYGPSSLTHNCSGKHAAMLATCKINNWPLEDYLHPAHPLQQQIETTISELVGESPAAITADGCGAPLFAYSLAGLAGVFARIAAAPAESDVGRVAAAIKKYSLMMSGTGRDDVLLMQAVPSLFTKGGAEGVQLIGVFDSERGAVGIAVKIADGNNRACLPVSAFLLEKLGVPAEQLEAIATSPVLGGGRPVGVVRAATHLQGTLAE